MTTRTHLSAIRTRAAASRAICLCCIIVSSASCSRPSKLSASLSDKDFWRVIEGLSEPPGAFTLSENFVSNEPYFVENLRRLQPVGGVYIGVGPEQNFSYIARLRPAMAFIVDIRRENRSLHLLYKALFELSSDRTDFVSRLFSRPRPDGLGAGVDVDTLFREYLAVPASLQQYERTAALVREHVVTIHGFPLSQIDLDWIERALKAFYTDGPEIHFWGARDVQALRPPYWRLMTARDVTGESRSFLATEDGFRFVKELHARNLIVPVVGDFAGPTALQRVGEYVRERTDFVRAFYGSNVGVYLTREQTRAFCRNLTTLPAAPRAWFIESNSVRSLADRVRACSPDRT